MTAWDLPFRLPLSYFFCFERQRMGKLGRVIFGMVITSVYNGISFLLICHPIPVFVQQRNLSLSLSTFQIPFLFSSARVLPWGGRRRRLLPSSPRAPLTLSPLPPFLLSPFLFFSAVFRCRLSPTGIRFLSCLPPRPPTGLTAWYCSAIAETWIVVLPRICIPGCVPDFGLTACRGTTATVRYGHRFGQ